jgi:hypothetical protein
MYYVRIGSRTGSPCVHVLATGLGVPHRKFFIYFFFCGLFERTICFCIYKTGNGTALICIVL